MELGADSVKSRFLDLPSLSLRAALGMTNVLRPRGMAIRNALVNKKRDPGGAAFVFSTISLGLTCGLSVL